TPADSFAALIWTPFLAHGRAAPRREAPDPRIAHAANGGEGPESEGQDQESRAGLFPVRAGSVCPPADGGSSPAASSLPSVRLQRARSNQLETLQAASRLLRPPPHLLLRRR